MKPLYQDLPFPIDSHIHYYIEDLPHFIVPWHYHPAIEIMYITRGIGTRFVGDCIEQYEEGDVCMIGPNLPHEWRNDDAYFDKESGLRATCICLFFKREIFDPNFIRLPEMNNIRDLIERSRRGLKFTGKSKLEITRFIRSSVNDVGVRKVTNLLTLLELMATSTEYELLASVGFTNSVNSEDFERFNKVYKFLVKNFATSIRLEEVSTLVGLTPTAFCRYFKERTKKTFVEYLNEMRIGKPPTTCSIPTSRSRRSPRRSAMWTPRISPRVFSARVGMRINDYRKTYRRVESICRIETDRRVYALVEYICRSYNEPLSARAVAEKFGCTAAEMNRALMLQVEKNFEEFLNYVRINRAAELLLTTDQTVTYIAMEVGYANVKTFNRNFLRFKVMTPGDFRKKVALQESRL